MTSSAKTNFLVVSSSPHIKAAGSVSRIMWDVNLALIPAAIAAVYFFGLPALRTIVITVISCVVFEAALQKLFGKRITISDGSAVVTGVLLAYNLPPTAPWWMAIVGGFVAMFLGKHLYGGLGNNPFNPALVSRVVLLVAWPSFMTTFPAPLGGKGGADAISTATPLNLLKTDMDMGLHLRNSASVPLSDLFVGNVAGSLGEVSALALLLGAIYLLMRKVISWHIPVSYMGTVVIFSGIYWIIDPTAYASPAFHLFAGGLMLGALFMATDMVTTPMTGRGMLIFGVGCGLLTMIIRFYGGYPEGVSFSILFMNALTPLIDKFTKPKVLGEVKK
ncbi:MAG: RnfABCDGE type electron transport complex subunit D [Candidatus Coatesbacteria bacterium]|nr:RnfABCDGE type electron transport complex subunit D [Candidatus Coatesbacteria bacterium]